MTPTLIGVLSFAGGVIVCAFYQIIAGTEPETLRDLAAARQALTDQTRLAQDSLSQAVENAALLADQEKRTHRWADQAASNAQDAEKWAAVARNMAQVSQRNRTLYDRQVRAHFGKQREIA